MKKKLLIFHPTIAPYRVDLFNDLSMAFDTRVRLNYIFGTFKNPSKFMAQMEFEPVFLKRKRGREYQVKFSEYSRQLKDFNPDIVITGEFGVNTIATLLYKCLHRKRYKVVSLCDDSYDMIANHNDFSLKHRLMRRIITPFIDDLILVEPRVVKWFQEHYHKGIWFPIIRDDDKARKMYERLLQESQKVIDEYHLAGKHVFLFVGRLVALKNVKTIIQAFKKLNDNNSVMVIIGSGEEEDNLHKEAEGMKNVIFTGRLEGDDLYKWYNVANAFILTSYQEPFGAVANEALLAGCWAIISNKAGSQCLVKPGINGDTFEPMDEEELTSKMEYVRQNLHAVPDKLELRENGMVFGYEEMSNNLITGIKV